MIATSDHGNTTEVQSSHKKPVFKILSLDGGGYKGLSTAMTLAVIEKYQAKHFVDHFDMMCGTSTGGLITLALAAGKRADEVVDFYKQHGPTIFPRLNRFQLMGYTIRVLTSVNKHKYSNRPLKKAVETIVGSLQIRDARCFLCIPSLNITTFRPRVFKTDHAHELNLDSQLLMSDVALATSAAPTFFPISTFGDSNPEYFVDGGIWANNPSMVGLTEAMRFFVGPDKPYGSVQLLSVGCATGIAGRGQATTAYSRWGHNFASEMIEAAGEAQQKAVLWHLQFLQSTFQVPVTFTRIDIAPLSSQQAKAVSLDSATTEATDLLLQVGKDTGHAWKSKPEIQAFFENPAAKIRLKSTTV